MIGQALSRASAVSKGQLIRIVSMFSYSLMIGCIKYSTEQGVHLLEALFLRSFFAIPIIFLSCILLNPQGAKLLKPKSWKAQSIRTLLGTLGMTLTFLTIFLLPTTEATSLILTAPLFAPLIAYFVLSERVTLRQVSAVLIGLAGVAVVAGPALAGNISKLGIIIGLCAAVTLASVSVTLRHFASSESAWATTFFYTCVVSVVFGCIYPWFAQAHSGPTWGILILTAVSGSIGQGLSAFSFHYGSVSELAFIDYTQIFWAVVIGFLVWSVIPPLTTLLGSVLIIISCLVAMKFR